MISARDKIKEEFIDDVELAGLLNCTPDVIKDKRSKHKTGKIKFIDSYSPSKNVAYFKYEDVRDYILASKNGVIGNES